MKLGPLVDLYLGISKVKRDEQDQMNEFISDLSSVQDRLSEIIPSSVYDFLTNSNPSQQEYESFARSIYRQPWYSTLASYFTGEEYKSFLDHTTEDWYQQYYSGYGSALAVGNPFAAAEATGSFDFDDFATESGDDFADGPSETGSVTDDDTETSATGSGAAESNATESDDDSDDESSRSGSSSGRPASSGESSGTEARTSSDSRSGSSSATGSGSSSSSGEAAMLMSSSMMAAIGALALALV